MKTTYTSRVRGVLQAALLASFAGCQAEPPAAPTPATEPAAPAVSSDSNGGDPTAIPSPDEAVVDEPERPDPQAELKAMLEDLLAQFDRPTEAPPFVPLPGGKAFLTNDQGEIVKVGLNYTPATDDVLARLAEIQSLESISLAGTDVTDEGFLKLTAVKALKFVNITGTAVTEAAREEFMQALPECKIRWMP